jgi:predicted transposase/invertase (TIGR01784 family)
MLYTEFDEELAKKTWQEEAFEDGMEAGIEKGIEKGIAEGAAQNAIETAKRMLSYGIDVEQISKMTLLSIEEIQNLRGE